MILSAPEVDAITENSDQIVLALIAIIGTSVAALVYTIRNNRTVQAGAQYAETAAKQASAANAAVNNVGPGDHSLYDLVVHVKEEVDELREAQKDFIRRGWQGLQPPIDTAIGLTTTINEIQHDHDALHAKLDHISDVLAEHVAWEMATKYGDTD